MAKIATPKSDAQLGLDVLYTYRYLRGAMIAFLLMLVFSVVYQAVMVGGCFLGSISAYYYTPARAIFVGALFALGALLIVHKARSPEEDVLLDFSGFMAFVVAIVPTVPDTVCGASPGLPAADIANAVRNNIWALLVVFLVAAAVRYYLRRTSGQTADTTVGARIASVACAAVLVVELGFFLLKRDSFIALSHGIAAATMVGGIIVVMVLNAVNQTQDQRGQRFRKIYLALATALAVSLAATVALHLWSAGFRHFILVAELIVIVLFGAFWVVQSAEFWDSEPKQIQEQVRAAEPMVPSRRGTRP